MPATPQFKKCYIHLHDPPLDMANYCVLSGKFYNIAEMSLEHPLPMVLGGNKRHFIVPTLRTLNNRIGSKIEQVVAQDKIIMFGRRDTGAKGHRKQRAQNPSFDNVALVVPNKEKSIFASPRDFHLESRKPHPVVTHKKSQKRLPQNIFKKHCAFTTFERPTPEMVKLAIKVAVCVSWRIFGQSIEPALAIDTMRKALVPECDIDQYWGEDLAWAWEGLQLNPETRTHFESIMAASIRRHKSTLMICEQDGFVEFALTCLGYFVAAVQVRATQRLLDGTTELGQRLIIVFEQKRFSIEVEVPSN